MAGMIKNWSLQDWANVAQILGLLALPLSIALWYFTRAHFEKFWKKWRKVVFVALAIVATAGAAFRGWFAWLTHPFTLPVWILILVAVLPAALLFGVLWLVVKLKELSKPAKIGPEHYITDRIFNVVWVWGYKGHLIDEGSLSAFCPNADCKCRLTFKDDNERGWSGNLPSAPVSLVCPNCGFREDFDFRRRELFPRVSVEIERRIRTGEYKKSLAVQSSAP